MPTVKNHNEILEWWGSVVKREKVHHAYLVVGAYKNATRALLRELMEHLGVKVNDTFTSHPDVILLSSQDTEDEGKKNISVEEVRDAISRLRGFSATSGGWRVVVVENVEDVSGNAANALLKVLEEPGVRTLFFLITGSVDKVIPTVRSRCHSIFTLPPKEWRQEHLATISKKEKEFCEAFLKGSAVERWGVVNTMFTKEKTWPFKKTRDTLTFWNHMVYDAWQVAQKEGRTQDALRLKQLLDTIMESGAYAQANVQTRLIFEHMITQQTF